MTAITVHTGTPYQVLVETGLLDRVGELVASLYGQGYSQAQHSDSKPVRRRVMVVSDDTVYSLYGKRTEDAFLSAGFPIERFVFPHGEGSKTMGTLTALLEALAIQQFTRTDLIAALGGGVVGDLAGFAAAVYLRGIDVVQIPTTFLSAIDSSVGGKTGVDLAAGKNLAGAFHQPRAVLCDPAVFATLSDDIFADGVAEAIKYGVIRDAELFDVLAEQDLRQKIEWVVSRCVGIKRDVVEIDELDHGERQVLNFGHTAGHAVEALSRYTLSHGKSVAIGMMVVSRAAERRGLVTSPVTPRLRAALTRYGLPTECPFSAAELARAALSDKKRKGDHVTFVLPSRIGSVLLYPVEVAALEDMMQSGLRSGVGDSV